jgi:hypothetical protein
MPAPPAFVFDDGAAYELMMGRWSALVAQPFLNWLAFRKDWRGLTMVAAMARSPSRWSCINDRHR